MGRHSVNDGIENKLCALRAAREKFRANDPKPGFGKVLVLGVHGTYDCIDAANAGEPPATMSAFAKFAAKELDVSERHIWSLLRVERGLSISPAGLSLRAAVRLAGVDEAQQASAVAPHARRFGRLSWTNHLVRVLGNSSSFTLWRQSTCRDGSADIGGVHDNGRAVQIQTKLMGERTTSSQEAWRQSIERVGGTYVLATYDPSMDIASNVERVRVAILTRKGGR